ncbi:hypothetical protein [Mycobacterium sp.]|uniref:hypothetical protein n=1 Tax=Mycobacterium sp. TaxID=1785 RepID=UPI003C7618BB
MSGAAKRGLFDPGFWLSISGVSVVALTYLRYRRWRLESVARRPKRLVRARGLTNKRAARAADPRRVGVW